jgi:hypothetical protein
MRGVTWSSPGSSTWNAPTRANVRGQARGSGVPRGRPHSWPTDARRSHRVHRVPRGTGAATADETGPLDWPRAAGRRGGACSSTATWRRRRVGRWPTPRPPRRAAVAPKGRIRARRRVGAPPVAHQWFELPPQWERAVVRDGLPAGDGRPASRSNCRRPGPSVPRGTRAASAVSSPTRDRKTRLDRDSAARKYVPVAGPPRAGADRAAVT